MEMGLAQFQRFVWFFFALSSAALPAAATAGYAYFKP
jgi:hypothetical protein